MSSQKIRQVFLRTFAPLMPALAPLILALIPLMLTGCQPAEDFPSYEMERHEDNSESLRIDGVQYRREADKGWDEQAYYFNDGAQYTWTPAEGIGKQIGICGEDADKGYGWAIYEIAGDADRAFLYTSPRRFYFGGVDGCLWMRDGVTLEPPAAETVSSITAVSGNEENAFSVQVDNPAMIASLLEAYSGEAQEAVDFTNSGDWLTCSLIMHHRDFPFLQYEIECRCSPEQHISYCRNAAWEWFALPAEWFDLLSKQPAPANGIYET